MKTYTFLLSCSFRIQRSFIETEVESDPGERATDVVPTEAALLALRAGIEAVLGEQYSISSISIDGESDDLLGVENEDS